MNQAPSLEVLKPIEDDSEQRRIKVALHAARVLRRVGDFELANAHFSQVDDT